MFSYWCRELRIVLAPTQSPAGASRSSTDRTFALLFLGAARFFIDYGRVDQGRT